MISSESRRRTCGLGVACRHAALDHLDLVNERVLCVVDRDHFRRAVERLPVSWLVPAAGSHGLVSKASVRCVEAHGQRRIGDVAVGVEVAECCNGPIREGGRAALSGLVPVGATPPPLLRIKS